MAAGSNQAKHVSEVTQLQGSEFHRKPNTCSHQHIDEKLPLPPQYFVNEAYDFTTTLGLVEKSTFTIQELKEIFENSIVIAFLCALLNLIPYVGPLIGGVLMLFLTMSSNLGQDFQEVILPTTIYVMIGYVIAQLIDNFLSQPLIFSNSVKSHPLEIFLIMCFYYVITHEMNVFLC